MAIRQRPRLLGLTAILWMTMVLAIVMVFHYAETEPIDSFAACADAGYPVTDGNPPVCHHGASYVTGPVNSGSVDAAAVESQPFSLLAAADSGTATRRANVVIHTQATWVRWWQKIHAGLTLPPLLPVDFTKYDVVVIVQGPKTTDGYGYKITGISQAKRATVIDTSESIPTIGCPVQNRQTNRYYLAQTPKLADPVVFRNTVQSRHCPE